jgi:hypothetical protein
VAKALIKALDEPTGTERSIQATRGAMRQGLQQPMAADHRLSPAQQWRAVEAVTERLRAEGIELRPAKP